MDRISRISDADFWKGWGMKPDYAALAARHRESTKGEWAHAIAEAKRRFTTADGKKASDLHKGRITMWHEATVEFRKRIDFRNGGGRSNLYGLHYMYWLEPLVDRFLLEQDPKDLALILDIVDQYYAQRLNIPRPYPHLDPVYYELGAWVKIHTLVPAYLAMLHAGTPTRRHMESFLKLFVGLGRSLLSLQETGYRPGNWQVGGSYGLFRLGALFSGHRESARWRKRALEMMRCHVEKDFTPDGGHSERNWPYGWLTLECVIRTFDAADRRGFLSARDRARFLARIRGAFRWYLKTLAPGGIYPAYGDALLEKADRLLAAARRFLPPSDFERLGKASSFLPDSGYAVMRDGTGRYLSVNFGKSGGPHTHEDLLDFSLWAFGRPLLEELGRFGSYDEPLTPTFAAPAAHNQVTIDGHVMHRHESEGKGIRWRAGRDTDFFSGWHEAFDDCPPSKWAQPKRVRIHRRILFVRGAYWVIQDVVEPAQETIYTISSWLHSPKPFRVTSPGMARTDGCLVAFAEPLKRLETGTDYRKSEVKGYAMYPERHFLRARQWGPVGFRGAHVFTMLLLPFAGKAPKASIRALGGNAFEVRTPFGRRRLAFSAV